MLTRVLPPLLPETTTLLRILLLPFEPVSVVGQFENCLTLVKTCEAGVTQAPPALGHLSRGGGGGTLAGVTYHTPSTLPSVTLASASVTYHYCLLKQFWYTLLYQNRSLWSTLKY